MGYVKNLNNLLLKTANYLQKNGDEKAYIEFMEGLKFDGGGHYNYEFFWECLAPQTKSREPTSGKLYDMIKKEYGDFNIFKGKLTGIAESI